MDQVFITGRGKDAQDAAAAEIGKNVAAKFRVDVSKFFLLLIHEVALLLKWGIICISSY
jgi:hypothetical protein